MNHKPGPSHDETFLEVRDAASLNVLAYKFRVWGHNARAGSVPLERSRPRRL